MSDTRSSPPPDDARLQAAYRELADPVYRAGALEERVMAQWRVACAPDSVTRVSGGALARFWPPGRRTLMGAALLLIAMALVAYTQRPDPLLEELSQPDVLSEIMLDVL